mmetsp:Transcript_4096/g.6002  ORF Transcript_4096/g.6002 Transcript_4096/m.6002 type:complete len:264 (+) Transcript_4096:200-991(+)
MMHLGVFLCSSLLVDLVNLLGIRLGDRKSLGLLGRGRVVLSHNETGVPLDEDEETQERGRQNCGSHDNKSLLVSQLTESQSESDGSTVSSSTDNSGNGSGGRGVHVRDDTVGRSLGGLNQQGEEDHDDNGSRQSSRVGKNQNEGTLSGKKNSLDPKTTAHSHAGVGLIGHVSSSTTCKQVHPTKDGSNGGSRLSGLVELIDKVKSGGVVHGQFHSEAASVLDEQKPSVEVEGSLTEGSGGGDFGHLSVLLQFAIVSLGGIFGD